MSSTIAAAAERRRCACTYTKWPVVPRRRQIAAPVPPLPPVTRALVASWFIFRSIPCVEHHRRAAAQQLPRPGLQRKFIQRAALISRHQHGFAVELGVAVVEPQHMQPNIPKGGEKAG